MQPNNQLAKKHPAAKQRETEARDTSHVPRLQTSPVINPSQSCSHGKTLTSRQWSRPAASQRSGIGTKATGPSFIPRKKTTAWPVRPRPEAAPSQQLQRNSSVIPISRLFLTTPSASATSIRT